MEQAAELAGMSVVGIVGSAKSGTAAAVQSFLQRVTAVAQLGACMPGWSLCLVARRVT